MSHTQQTQIKTTATLKKTIKFKPKKKNKLVIKKKTSGNKCVLCERTDCVKKDQWGHWICSDDEDEPETDDDEKCVGCGINPKSTTNWEEGDAPRDYCDKCYLEDQETDDEDIDTDANGNTQKDYEDAELNCPKGHIVVWNKWEKGFKYRPIDEDGYVITEDYEEIKKKK